MTSSPAVIRSSPDRQYGPLRQSLPAQLSSALASATPMNRRAPWA